MYNIKKHEGQGTLASASTQLSWDSSNLYEKVWKFYENYKSSIKSETIFSEAVVLYFIFGQNGLANFIEIYEKCLVDHPPENSRTLASALLYYDILTPEEIIQIRSLFETDEQSLIRWESISLVVAALSQLSEPERRSWFLEVGASNIASPSSAVSLLIPAAMIRQTTTAEELATAQELYRSFQSDNAAMAQQVFDFLMSIGPEVVANQTRAELRESILATVIAPDASVNYSYIQINKILRFLEGLPARDVNLFKSSGGSGNELFTEIHWQRFAQELGTNVAVLQLKLQERSADTVKYLSTGYAKHPGSPRFNRVVVFGEDPSTISSPSEHDYDAEKFALYSRGSMRQELDIQPSMTPTPYDLERITAFIAFDVNEKLFLQACSFILAKKQASLWKSYEAQIQQVIGHDKQRLKAQHALEQQNDRSGFEQKEQALRVERAKAILGLEIEHEIAVSEWLNQPISWWGAEPEEPQSEDIPPEVGNFSSEIREALKQEQNWLLFIDAQMNRINMLQGTVALKPANRRPAVRPSSLNNNCTFYDQKDLLKKYHWSFEVDDKNEQLQFILVSDSDRIIRVRQDTPYEVVVEFVKEKLDELQHVVRLLLPEYLQDNYLGFDYDEDADYSKLIELDDLIARNANAGLREPDSVDSYESKRIYTAATLAFLRNRFAQQNIFSDSQKLVLGQLERAASSGTLDDLVIERFRDEFRDQLNWNTEAKYKNIISTQNYPVIRLSNFKQEVYTVFDEQIFRALCILLRTRLAVSDEVTTIDCKYLNLEKSRSGWPPDLAEAIDSGLITFKNLKRGMKEHLGLRKFRHVIEGDLSETVGLSLPEDDEYINAIIVRAAVGHDRLHNKNGPYARSDYVEKFGDYTYLGSHSERSSLPLLVIESVAGNPIYANNACLRIFAEHNIFWEQLTTSEFKITSTMFRWPLAEGQELSVEMGSEYDYTREVEGTVVMLTEQEVLALVEDIKNPKINVPANTGWRHVHFSGPDGKPMLQLNPGPKI